VFNLCNLWIQIHVPVLNLCFSIKLSCWIFFQSNEVANRSVWGKKKIFHCWIFFLNIKLGEIKREEDKDSWKFRFFLILRIWFFFPPHGTWNAAIESSMEPPQLNPQWKKKMKDEGILVISCLTITTKGILVISHTYESFNGTTSSN